MPPAAAHPGLCAACIHAQRIVSDRGSEFWLCRKGLTDPEFAKYPKLPVTRCGGYEAVDRKQAENFPPRNEADE